MGILISIVISIFVPNLSKDACGAILALIPTNVPNLDCDCKFDITGFFDVVAEASTKCTIPELVAGGGTCSIAILGKGSATSFAFGGGAADLAVDSTCNYGPGEITVDVDGALALLEDVPVSVKTCAITGTLSGNPLTCQCSAIGCSTGNPFSAQIVCPGTPLNACINFLEVATELQDALN